MSDDAVISPAGWCVPEGVAYSPRDAGPSAEFPTVTVQRGGSPDWFPAPGTPEWHRQQQERERTEILQRYVSRMVGDILRAQHAVLDAACLEALRDSYDVHVHRHPYKPTRFIGIELAPRETERIFPTVHEHTREDRWGEDRWEEEW